jgi:DNA-directed RNA polymerase specialized sigma24 family protein
VEIKEALPSWPPEVIEAYLKETVDVSQTEIPISQLRKGKSDPGKHVTNTRLDPFTGNTNIVNPDTHLVFPPQEPAPTMTATAPLKLSNLRADKLAFALSHLSEGQAEILRLLMVEGCTRQDIARRLNISLRTVRTQCEDIEKNCRKLFSPDSEALWSDFAAKIHRYLSELSEDEKKLAALIFASQLAHSQIAKEFQIREQRVHRTKKRLLKRLKVIFAATLNQSEVEDSHV